MSPSRDRTTSVLSGAAALLLALASPSTARAEPASRARSLFDEAKELALSGRYAEACPLLEQSMRLDPGLGAMFNLADCYEHIGRLGSASALFARVQVEARTAQHPEREIRARDRVLALEPRVAHLTILVPPSSRVAGLEVTRDGDVVPPTVWGLSLPVDVGEHDIVAKAAGARPWRLSVEVARDGESTEVLVPALEPVVVESAVPSPERIAPPARESGHPSLWTSGRVAGVIVAAAGTVLLGGGVALGAVANSDYGDARASCVGGNTRACGPDAVAAGNRAYDRADLATGLMIGGAATVVAGVAVFFLFGRPRSPRPSRASVAAVVTPTGWQW